MEFHTRKLIPSLVPRLYSHTRRIESGYETSIIIIMHNLTSDWLYKCHVYMNGIVIVTIIVGALDYRWLTVNIASLHCGCSRTNLYRTDKKSHSLVLWYQQCFHRMQTSSMTMPPSDQRISMLCDNLVADLIDYSLDSQPGTLLEHVHRQMMRKPRTVFPEPGSISVENLIFKLIGIHSIPLCLWSLHCHPLASSPGHSHVFNVSACNIENMGVAWGRG